MSEEEFFKRLLNKITKEFGYDVASTLELMFMTKEKKVEQLEKEIERLNNIINELEKYIHNELVLDFYNDDMPCELIINKMEKMIKKLKANNK